LLFLHASTIGIFTLSLHDALPIFLSAVGQAPSQEAMTVQLELLNPSSEINNGIAKVEVHGGSAPYQYKWSNVETPLDASESVGLDRKSTRLNSSHVKISYAVFCLK